MSNHITALLNRKSCPEEIENLLNECNQNRFKGKFEMSISENAWVEGDTHFLLYHKDPEYYFLGMWIHPDNVTLEFRMARSDGMLALGDYLQWVFFQYPVVKIGGIIDPEEESFEATFAKRYPTFKDYVENGVILSKKHTKRDKEYIKRILDDVPQELRGIV